MATVSLQGLTKKFSQLAAVEDLRLDIKDGEFVSLLGPSGCGKTTTLRLVAGFLEPDGGEIRVNDAVISSPSVLIPPERRNMSMIFQSYAVWPHMTVAQNVAYGLKFKKISKNEADQKVTRLLELVHLETLRERYPGELSGGQQQRVALARALVVEPQILLLDEPLSNLDANLREEMRFEIRRLHEEFGITTIYVTHDQGEAMVASDRIVVMNRGKIVQVGSPQEIFDFPKTRFVAEFIGKTNILPGRVENGENVILAQGLPMTVAKETNLSVKGETFVCVRPHNIVLVGTESEAQAMVGRGFNLFPGIIQRRIYFGDAIDYMIDISPCPVPLRAVSPPSNRYEKGQKVFALAHPQHCIIVGEG
jgi:iron(III) transport system ATP-binding protein